ncbi:hypothetical protein ACFP63_13875 [Oerskovia jenensis]|uniref:Uncharacterized protein n=1 Tax=Oerskovia jenensis TaxID=162169 RepID=A0ABS2LA25_9CELL|nr:hypothetical protein [Oerskovia jenensis]MBM7477286.1 hypothetical protein [Oerskovia jenensis]
MSHCLSMRFAGYLAREGIATSIGTVGDDNYLMESIIGLFKN